MKRAAAVLLVLASLIGIAGCAGAGTGGAGAPSPGDGTDWDFYNERAGQFVTAMADGDFDGAHAMLDTTMRQAVSVSALESDIWNLIVGQAGAFAAVHEIENQLLSGYYVCFTTSEHELKGVTLRVVFSADGLIAGLYIDGYPEISERAAEHEGFTEAAVIIGEGTDYPLDGILSMPDGAEGKVPAAVLVHGSGPQDRDETIYACKPFLDIAEYLASSGIAVLRYDKRTYSHGEAMVLELGGGLTVREETIEDAILATELLKADPRIDADRVYIIGHSLGGMLAPRIHSEGGDYAGLILLAGSPRSLLDIGYDQQMAMLESMPEGEEKDSLLKQMESYDEQAQALLSLSDEEARATQTAGGVSAYYFKEMDAHPASAYIESITKPFLVLQGSMDFQVYPEKDFALYKELLGSRENVSFKLYDGLNHLFIRSSGKGIADLQEEYGTAGHVDERVLRDIAQWISG